MRSKFGDNEPQDVSYHGNAFLRLMGYIKPYRKQQLEKELHEEGGAAHAE